MALTKEEIYTIIQFIEAVSEAKEQGQENMVTKLYDEIKQSFSTK